MKNDHPPKLQSGGWFTRLPCHGFEKVDRFLKLGNRDLSGTVNTEMLEKIGVDSLVTDTTMTRRLLDQYREGGLLIGCDGLELVVLPD
ncbi:MAG: hypothetical protein HQL73_07815 [Magnetococcales bacterium]|nr:hypothetical protein [Magnetococcales bacterium]